MGSAIDNRHRAMGFMYERDRLGASFADSAQRLERMLNEAEDRGRAEAEAIPSADPLTVEALRGMVQELLEEALDPTASLERANAITQVLIGNFRMYLVAEEEALDGEYMERAR